MRSKVLVIIPAYNEEENISHVIAKVNEYQPGADILVINDGSTDQTSAAATREGAKVLTLPFNMGYGSALQTGFIYAQQEGYEFAVQMDGDGQHDPKCIDDLLKEIQNGSADIVVGSRFLQHTGYKTTLIRRLGMITFGTVASLIIRQKISDSTSGFQAMNRRVIEFYASDLYPSDFPDADLLILLSMAGLKIKEVGVTMYQSSKNKSMHRGIFKPIYYVFKMLLSILTTLLREKP